jgi:prefoldin subunit 5
MTDQFHTKIDINHADAQQLIQVSGIGPALAEKIIQSRPYNAIEELTNIPGISTKSLEILRPHLVCEVEEDTSPAEDLPEAEVSIETPTSKETPDQTPKQVSVSPPMEKAQPVKPEEKPPVSMPQKPLSQSPAITRDVYIRRSDGLWWGIGLAIVVLVLSLIFSLGTLNIVNNTLTYAPASQVQALDARAEELATQVQTINGDLSSLRTRMDALETLSGRIASLEKDNEVIHGELEDLQQQADALENKSEELSQQVIELQKSSTRFQNFLDGLRQLLIPTDEQ